MDLKTQTSLILHLKCAVISDVVLLIARHFALFEWRYINESHDRHFSATLSE